MSEPIIDNTRSNSKLEMEQRVLSEARATGFTHIDPEVTFFTQVAALVEPEHVLLDFGAGRGEWYEDDPVRFRRNLQNFRGRVAHVDGCDVDPVVMQNRTLDAAAVITPGEPLPYEDGRFDVVVSRYVFEHISDPEWAARELRRVTKPGGWICAITPNKTGYVAIVSRCVPNRLHSSLLARIQPQRKQQDAFFTAYKLNTPSDLRRYFGQFADVHFYRASGVPAYYWGQTWLFRLLLFVHRILPPFLETALFILMRKR